MSQTNINIFYFTFVYLFVIGTTPCFPQREAQEVRYGSRWQIKMLKDKLSYDLAAPSDKEKKRYQTLLKNNFSTVMYIENMLTTNGLPKMLRNLVMIESGFDNSSISSANAIGIWQITPSHAETYGLAPSSLPNVSQSSRVAIVTLKDLYAKYKNWIKVIAAYNCGPANLDRAMARARSNRYDVFYKFLPDETINHVNKFMSACYITDELGQLMENYKGMNPDTNSQPEPPKTTTNANDPTLVSTTITPDSNPQIIARCIKVTDEAFKGWNPNLESDLKKYGKGTMYLPISSMGEFMSKRNEIVRKSASLKK